MRHVPKLALALPLLLVLSAPAQAVILLDSTWSDDGGAEGAESEGFTRATDLALEPQFAGVMSFFDGSQVGASGTWIGNDDEGHGYVLTAAHNFGSVTDPSIWHYYSSSGELHNGKAVYIHPNYEPDTGETAGYDMAIVVLETPITDAGEAPWLYWGDEELGETATMVGYGSRGIGSVGQDDKYYKIMDAAAARNVIDYVEDPFDDERSGNQLLVDFDSEDGAHNVFLDGDAYPVDPLEGVLGSGDSGGSLWIETDSGWMIVGVNAWGDDAVYGSTGGFARISTQYDWIAEIFPDAGFSE